MKSSEIDRRHAYLKHRLRVQCIKSIIDHHPPKLIAMNFCKFSQLQRETTTFRHLNWFNGRMYVNINGINLVRGEVDSFRTTENSYQANYSKEAQKLRILQAVEHENMRLGKRLLCIKGELKTRQGSAYMRKHKSKKLTKSFIYPAEILAKYSHEFIPEEPKLAKQFLRPKIWFHLEVKGIRPLGRIVMELYTEAAPQVVLEFVRLCLNKQKNRINFMRLFPSLWLEGEVSLDYQTLIGKHIEYDKRAVDHGRHNGVLSFSLENIKLFQRGILNFTISFKHLSVLNGRRVGFGHIVEGAKVLNCIQDYGTKNGKPSKEIVVSDCGIFV